MIKAEEWDGKDLKGLWVFSKKIDGVRCLITDGKVLSRSDKPLYNVPDLPNGDYKIFAGSWEKRIRWDK